MADDDCLTEELVVRHGGQYDPELLQRLTLSGLRLARLGAGLARCTALRVLDLARNKLQHLDGVEVCASLERLLVARNELTRFGFVAGLAKLYVGEIVETARSAMEAHGEVGAIQPRHLREAHRTVREHDEVRAQCLKRPFALLQSRPRVRRKIGALE